MKMKKLISFLCAAALTVSSFAGLTVTASAAAADTVAITPTVGSKTVTVKKEGTTVKQGVLLHAVYTNGALTSVESQNIPATDSADADVTYDKANYAAYVDSTKTGSKILAWKSLQGMEPITVNIVEPPAAKTQVSTVADVTISRAQNDTYPATLTATVTAKQDAQFNDTTSFTYSWSKDGVAVNGGTNGTLTAATAGSYTVTATYNNSEGNFEGEITSAPFTVEDPGDLRTSVADLVTVTITAADNNTNTPTTLTAAVADVQGIDTPTGLTADDFTYVWTKDGVTVADATTKTLAVAAGDAGEYKVVATVKSDNANYKGSTPQSAGIRITEPAAPYVTAANGKIKAVSVTATAADADKTYKQLKEAGIFAEGELKANQRANNAYVGSYTIVEVDATDLVASAATNKIELGFTVPAAAYNSEIYTAKLAAPSGSIADLTSTAASALAVSDATNNGWSSKSANTTYAREIQADIAAVAEADSKLLYYVIWTSTTREQNIVDLTLTSKTFRTVTVDSNITGGTVTADKTSNLVAGDKVIVTVAATNGYDYTANSLSVKDASNNAVATTPVENQVGKYEFTMPDSNVTVTAAFAELQGEPATVSVAYKTAADAAAVKTVPLTGTFVAGQKKSKVVESVLGSLKRRFVVASSNDGYYNVYKYKSGLDSFTDSDVLAAGANTIDVIVETDGIDYLSYNTFDDDTVGAWGTASGDKVYGGIVSSDAWYTGKLNGWAPGANSADKLTDGNQVVLLATHATGQQIKSSTLAGDASKTIYFDWAKNDSSGGRSHHIIFYDENGKEAFRVRMSMANKANNPPNGVGYSVDGGANFTSVYGTDDKNWHSYAISFDMVNDKVTLTFDGEKKADAIAFNSAATGSTISYFEVVSGYSVTSSVLDNLAVAPLEVTTPAAKTITWANTLTGFTVKKGNSAIDSGATLAANDVITIEATAADKKVKSVTATGATFTVTDGVASATVGATPADIVITAVELEDKPTTPAASATVAAATLHDTRTTGAIADDALYTAHDVQVGEAANGVTPVTINTTGLKKHQNGDTPESMGYWTGAKFTLANVPATAKYYLSLTKPTGAIDYSSRGAITQILDDGTTNEISIYQDAEAYKEGGANAGKKVYFAVEGIDTVYEIDFATGVTLSTPTIAWIEDGTQIKDIAVSIGGTPIESGAAIKAGDVIEISSSAPNKRITDVFTYSGFSFTLTSDGGATYTVGENPQSISLQWVKTETAYGIISSSSNPQTITLTSTVGEGETARELSMVTNSENVTLAIGGVPDGKVIESIELSFRGTESDNQKIENVEKVAGKENTYKFTVPNEGVISGPITVNVIVKTPLDSIRLDGLLEGSEDKVLADADLTANVIPVAAVNSVDYQWYLYDTTAEEWKPIQDATFKTYTPAEDTDSGHTIKVVVTAKSGSDYTGKVEAQVSVLTNQRDINLTQTHATISFISGASEDADSSNNKYIAPVGGKVIFQVTPEDTYAVGTVSVKTDLNGEDPTDIDIEQLENNQYSFTMPLKPVMITAVGAKSTGDKPNEAKITGPKTVKANGKEYTYAANLFAFSVPTTYDYVEKTYKVYYKEDENYHEANTSDAYMTDAGILKVNPNCKYDKLYIRAVVNDMAPSDKFTQIVSAYYEVNVTKQYIEKSFEFKRAKIGEDASTATPINGYLKAEETGENTNFFQLTALSSNFKYADSQQLVAQCENGIATLALDPNKKYKLTLYINENVNDNEKIYEQENFALTSEDDSTTTITVPSRIPETQYLHGVTVTPANAVVGDTVTLTYPKSDDYILKNFRLVLQGTDEDAYVEVDASGEVYTGTYTIPTNVINNINADRADAHTITNTTTDTNGTVTIDHDGKIYTGTRVTITVTPNANYEKYYFQIKKANGDNVDLTNVDYSKYATEGKYTFDMPDEDITLNVTFRGKEYVAYVPNPAPTDGYTGQLYVRLNGEWDPRNGDQNVRYGEEIKYTIAPKPGYEITKVEFDGTTYYKDAAAPAGEVDIANYLKGDAYEFVAEVKGNVAAPVVYTRTVELNITIAELTNGSITASFNDHETTTARLGETVKLTVNPSDHYKLETLSVSYNLNGSSISKSLSDNAEFFTKVDDGYTFEMPASAVTVNATFTLEKFEVQSAKDESNIDNNYTASLVIGAEDKGQYTGSEEVVYGTTAYYYLKPVSGMEITRVAFGGEIYTGDAATDETKALPAKETEGTYKDCYKFSVTVTADVSRPVVVTEPYRYLIQEGEHQNGSITITVGEQVTDRASKDATVKVTLNPNQYYELDELILKYSTTTGHSQFETSKNDGEGSFFKKVDGEDAYTFKMPNETVTLSAIFGNPTHTLVLPEATYDASTGFSIAGGEYKIYIDNDVQTTYAAKTVGWGKKIVINDVNPVADKYELESVTYTTGGTTTPIEKANDKYEFTMPNADTTIAVNFAAAAVTTHTITVPNKETDHGTVKVYTVTGNDEDGYTKSDEALSNLTAVPAGTMFVVEADPAEGYKLTDAGITVGSLTSAKKGDIENVYTMPAGDVTVEAEFEEIAPLADRTPDGSNIITYAANATQTVKDSNNKSYTVLTKADVINLSSELKQNFNKIYTEFDMRLADGDTLKVRGQNSNASYFSGQLVFTAADGTISVKTNTSSAGDVAYGSTTLETGKWYKVVFNATYTSNSATSAFDWAAYPITITNGIEEVGTTAVVSQTGLTARNIGAREYYAVQLDASGSPKIDNCFIYTDYKYSATVTVTDGTNPIEGATVTLDNAARSTATTNASGTAEFTITEGAYTATVEKSGYISPSTAPTLTVAKDGANTVAAVITAKVKTTLTVTAPESKEVIAGDENGITYSAVVTDQENNAMTPEEAPVVWSVFDSTGTTAISDGTITVSNGKITATSNAVAGTYTVKAVAGGNTTDYTDTFTVKNVSPATVTVNYVTTANDPETAIATETIDSFVGESIDLADTTNAATYLSTIEIKNTDAGTFKRYTIDAYETDAYKIAEIAATNTINVKVSTDNKDYFLYKDFEDGTLTPFVKQGGSVGPVLIENDNATVNPNTSKFLGQEHGSGDVIFNSGAIHVGTENDVLLEADFRFDPGEKNKTSELGLFGNKTASNWFSGDTNKEIFEITGIADNNMNLGSMYINTASNSLDMTKVAVTNTQAQYTDAKVRNTTGWLHLNAVVHPATEKVDITLTRISDGTEIVTGTYDFAKTGSYTGDLYIYMHHHRSYGGVSLDNVKVSIAK